MKKTLYDILGIDKNASQEEVQAAYAACTEKIRSQYEQGDADARNLNLAFKAAYEVLSDYQRRRQYDHSLALPPEREPVAAEPSGWFQGLLRHKVLLLGLCVVLLGGFYVRESSEKEKALIALKKAEQEAKAEAERLRIENERALIQGAVATQVKALDNGYSVQNRHLDLQSREQDRLARRLDYENAQASRAQDIRQQREEQNARYQAEQERRRQESQTRMAQMQADARSNREQRYWVCMNEALNRMSSEKANARCIGYR